MLARVSLHPTRLHPLLLYSSIMPLVISSPFLFFVLVGCVLVFLSFAVSGTVPGVQLPICNCQDEDNEYRLDGFVVGDEDDDGDASDGGKRRRTKGSSGDNKRKRLRKARDEHGIEAADDEDLELIREAQGVRCGDVKFLEFRALVPLLCSLFLPLSVWFVQQQ